MSTARIDRLAAAGARAHARLCEREGVDPLVELTEVRLRGLVSVPLWMFARLAGDRRRVRPDQVLESIEGFLFESLAPSATAETLGRPAPTVWFALLTVDAHQTGDPWTRRWIAEHTRSRLLLIDLAADPDVVVREVVAGNPRTPLAVLARFAVDPLAKVRTGVARNPDLPEALQRDLANVDEQPAAVRAYLADNPGLAPAVAELLAVDPAPKVRAKLALNEAVPLAIVERLARDPDAGIAALADLELEQRARDAA